MLKITAIGNLTNDVELKVSETMTNYDLTSIGAVSASAKLAHIRANQELEQSSYNAAWLHGYSTTSSSTR